MSARALKKLEEREELLKTCADEVFIGLPPQQYRFCMEYFKDFDQRAAAGRAGYTGIHLSQVASQLMRKPKIAAAMQKFKELLAETAKYSHEKAVEEIQEHMAMAVKANQHVAASRYLEMKLKITGHIQDKLSIEHSLKGNFTVQIAGIVPPPYALPEKDVTPQISAPKKKKLPDILDASFIEEKLKKMKSIVNDPD